MLLELEATVKMARGLKINKVENRKHIKTIFHQLYSSVYAENMCRVLIYILELIHTLYCVAVEIDALDPKITRK